MTDTAQEKPEPYVFDAVELRSIAEAVDVANKLTDSASATDLFFEVEATVKAGDQVLGQIRWDDGFIGFAARGVA